MGLLFGLVCYVFFEWVFVAGKFLTILFLLGEVVLVRLLCDFLSIPPLFIL